MICLCLPTRSRHRLDRALRRHGRIGSLLAPLGIDIAYKPAGIVVALAFIGLPFVVRSVEPVLAEVSREMEEASVTLGATRMQTFSRVIFPTIAPALATGFALAFARGVGEYGSVIFIAATCRSVGDPPLPDHHPLEE